MGRQIKFENGSTLDIVGEAGEEHIGMDNPILIWWDCEDEDEPE